MFKKPVVYVNIVLLVVVLLFVVNTFNLPGHIFIKRAIAAIGQITGEGSINYLPRFVGAEATTNAITDSIIYDDGLGHIGIGTATPAYTLDVVGDLNYTGTLRVNGTAFGGPTQWTTSGSNIYYNTGNVGIGTAGPGYKLDVAGSININGDGQYLRWSSGDAEIAETGYNLLFKTWTGSALTEKMRIQGDGNVGIGTTAPDTNFHVAGNVHIGTQTAFDNPGGWNKSLKLDGAIHARYRVLGSAYASGKNSATEANFWVDNSNGPSYAGVSSDAGLAFATNASYNFTFSGGNVGIGTTSPGYRLHVSGGSVKLTDYSNQVLIGGVGLLGYSSENLWMIGNGASSRLTLGTSWDWDTSLDILYTPGSSGALGGRLVIGQTNKNSATYTHGITSFNTNGTERVRIDSSGNVGIGTTTPASKLDVVGGVYHEGITVRSSSVSGAGIGLVNTDTGGHTFYLISGGTSNGIGAGALGIYDSTAGAYQLTINPSGNVGIGVTSPTYKLDVAGNMKVSSGDSSFTYYGPNTSWSGALYVGASPNRTSNNVAQVISTDGNLHLDSGSNNSLYLNYYSSSRPVYINGSNSVCHSGNNCGYSAPGHSHTGETWNILYRTYGFNSAEYDGNDSAYYVDPNGNSRFNYMGRNYGFNWTEYDWNDSSYYVDPASTSIYNDLRANIFYDRQDTGYYMDPNGTSQFYNVTNYTRQAFNLSRLYTNRRNNTSDQGYWTGSNGWGTGEGTWDTAWKWGFGGVDIWGTDSAHPQGAQYIHAQGIISGEHYANSDGSSAYGWMIVGAANATENRYWLRGKWSTSTSGWTEMMTSANNPYAWNMNQYLRTTDGPTFANIYASSWFRNYARTGIYNETYATHFYTDSSAYWRMSSNNGLMLNQTASHDSSPAMYIYHDSSNFGILNNAGNWIHYTPYNGVDVYFPAWGNWITSAATHRGEGTNYIDYSRYVYDDGARSGSQTWARNLSDAYVYYAQLGRTVYNNGAYSGSGWVEPSDLGVRYASGAGNADTVDSLHAASFNRKDTTGQWIKPYYEYGSYLTSESPATLASQMSSGGGLRVDFLHPGYTGSGGWNHVITWSGYNFYNMYQLGGHYDGGTGTQLWVRSEASHAGTGWTSWRRLLDSISDSYAYSMNQSVTTTASVQFGSLTLTGGITTQAGAGFTIAGAGIYCTQSSVTCYFNNGSSGLTYIGNTTSNTVIQGPTAYINGTADIGGSAFVGSYVRITNYTGDSPGPTLCKRSYDGYVGTCSSLREYKKDIEDLSLGLATLMQLRPREFDWKQPKGSSVVYHDLGFIAEEVEAINPLLAQYNEGKLSSVKYDKMSALLVKSIQEQQAQIEELKKTNKELIKRLEKLEAKLK